MSFRQFTACYIYLYYGKADFGAIFVVIRGNLLDFSTVKYGKMEKDIALGNGMAGGLNTYPPTIMGRETGQ